MFVLYMFKKLCCPVIAEQNCVSLCVALPGVAGVVVRGVELSELLPGEVGDG